MVRTLGNGRGFSRSPVRFALALAVVLIVGSMMLYPGGTVLDESTRGYSFAHNFLSDLGTTVTVSGGRNTLGAVLLSAAVIVGVLALAGSFVGTIRLLLPSPRARMFARLAAVAGALVCAGFLGAALTPIDRAPRLHNLSSLVACHPFPAATALLAIATRRDGRFRPRATAGWVMLTLVLAGFIAVTLLGPSASTELGLMTQVIMQKIMAATVLAVLWIESREVEAVSASGIKPLEVGGPSSPA
jgi:hypothetical membrane protein